ncbi:hypothetical protein ACEZDB_15760 [Streptacidiphilus sp. N1-3]|uniref:Neocarzinostatin family protein n=1 Tax=Streptacidiphilus alkalitolerans TaxID=3342712 RepID=A0ABV6X271_9ACTN
MRTARTLAAVGLAAAAMALPSSAAFAAGNQNQIEASPSTVAPGGTVTLSTAVTSCPKDSTLKVTEQNNGWAATLTRGTMSLVGTLQVPASAKPGAYTMVGSCPTGGLIIAGGFTVSGGTPVGPVRTGMGGSIGPDTAELAGGAGLAAAALVGAVALKRRRTGGDV